MGSDYWVVYSTSHSYIKKINSHFEVEIKYCSLY